MSLCKKNPLFLFLKSEPSRHLELWTQLSGNLETLTGSLQISLQGHPLLIAVEGFVGEDI